MVTKVLVEAIALAAHYPRMPLASANETVDMPV